MWRFSPFTGTIRETPGGGAPRSGFSPIYIITLPLHLLDILPAEECLGYESTAASLNPHGSGGARTGKEGTVRPVRRRGGQFICHGGQRWSL